MIRFYGYKSGINIFVGKFQGEIAGRKLCVYFSYADLAMWTDCSKQRYCAGFAYGFKPCSDVLLKLPVFVSGTFDRLLY